jgi:hypothetical protein
MVNIMDKVKFLKQIAVKLEDTSFEERIQLHNAITEHVSIIPNSALIDERYRGNYDFKDIYFSYNFDTNQMLTVGSLYPTVLQVVTIDETLKKLTLQKPKW